MACSCTAMRVIAARWHRCVQAPAAGSRAAVAGCGLQLADGRARGAAAVALAMGGDFHMLVSSPLPCWKPGAAC